MSHTNAPLSTIQEPLTEQEMAGADNWNFIGTANLSLGDILRNIRRRANESQKEFAARSGLTFRQVCGIENGRLTATDEQLTAYALCLQLDADLLLLASKGAQLDTANARADAVEERVKKFEKALTKINDIRNSIIAFQTMNFSEHVYPLVAALNETGIEGMHYPEALANYGTALERANKAEARINELEALQPTQEFEAVKRFYDATMRRADENMRKTNVVTGAHYNAMKSEFEVLAEAQRRNADGTNP